MTLKYSGSNLSYQGEARRPSLLSNSYLASSYSLPLVMPSPSRSRTHRHLSSVEIIEAVLRILEEEEKAGFFQCLQEEASSPWISDESGEEDENENHGSRLGSSQ